MPEPQVPPGTPPRGRFAPSPTGPLHLGSLSAALGSWLMARQRGGEWLLRIEDLDPPREKPGAAAQQLETLARFGLLPDGPVLFQSERHEFYAAALASLAAAGEAFECLCSRADLAASDGIHRDCVARPSGRRPAWRLRVPSGPIGFIDAIRGAQSQDLQAEVGDFVLRRADGYWAYQLAVVVDDALQGITEVVRGADLLDSTPRQLLLQRRLRLPSPAYAHLPLLLDSDGSKLSKSLHGAPVDGADPLPALRLAWRLLGQPSRALAASGNAEVILNRALAAFDPALIPARDLRLSAD
ncbi:MAG: tRNA glutamyl-Q(34) synthetase GluQRS [Arenimonas sp.]